MNLTTAGCLFVAGAGNGGRAHFTAGSPATAPEALSVGASLKTSETGTYLALDVSAPTSVAGVYPVGQTAEGPNIADYGTFSGEAVPAEPATACDPLTNAADVDGKIAIVSRGTCAYNNKAETAAAAGAIAVLMIDNVPVDHPVDGMTIDPPIPYWSLRYDDGVALLAAAPLTVSLTDGVAADVNAGPDFAAVFSARGPSARRLLLKPDLLAPGERGLRSDGHGYGSGRNERDIDGVSRRCRRRGLVPAGAPDPGSPRGQSADDQLRGTGRQFVWRSFSRPDRRRGSPATRCGRQRHGLRSRRRAPG